MNIVYGNQEKIDFESTLTKVKKVDTLNREIIDGVRDQVVIVLESTKTVDLLSASHTEFVPYRNLPENFQDRDRSFTYFELEIYPFFEKVKEVIAEKKKGVLRFRRNVTTGNSEAVIIEDLFVMSQLLGDPENVKVTKSKRNVDPQHVILTINFGQGTMAHMEYTLNDRERLEFEWSGIKSIIEFNSEEMCPITSKHLTPKPLTYSVDSILKASHKVDADLISQLKKWKEIVKGGDK